MTLDHGEYSISVSDYVISMKLKGAFNVDGAKAMFLEVKNIVRGFNGNKFSILVNFLALEGATPEAYEEANSYNLWLINKGITAKAIVSNSVAIKEIDIRRVPAQKFIETEFFNNVVEASKWLKERS